MFSAIKRFAVIALLLAACRTQSVQLLPHKLLPTYDVTPAFVKIEPTEPLSPLPVKEPPSISLIAHEPAGTFLQEIAAHTALRIKQQQNQPSEQPKLPIFVHLSPKVVTTTRHAIPSPIRRAGPPLILILLSLSLIGVDVWMHRPRKVDISS